MSATSKTSEEEEALQKAWDERLQALSQLNMHWSEAGLKQFGFGSIARTRNSPSSSQAAQSQPPKPSFADLLESVRAADKALGDYRFGRQKPMTKEQASVLAKYMLLSPIASDFFEIDFQPGTADVTEMKALWTQRYATIAGHYPSRPNEDDTGALRKDWTQLLDKLYPSRASSAVVDDDATLVGSDEETGGR
jgi:hypothetical protein